MKQNTLMSDAAPKRCAAQRFGAASLITAGRCPLPALCDCSCPAAGNPV